MAVFSFDIKPLFPQPIVRIKSNLLPHGFRCTKAKLPELVSKISEIIDYMGMHSAMAQQIKAPFTTAKKLREADDHVVYLMADLKAGDNGAIIGLLKIGKKNLYLFDEGGQIRQITKANSILDFYIHESHQRAGHGKALFEKMLKDENLTALEFTVDRPSEKMLWFLKKHYGLDRIIPQSNNFVLYKGFFDQYDNQMPQKNTQSDVYYRKSVISVQPSVLNFRDDNIREHPRGSHTQVGQTATTTHLSGGRYAHRPSSRVMFDVMSNRTNS